jgi:hypothetical protein
VGTHWVSREKNNAKLYENRMTTGKELSISESPWDFALCKVLFRYTREIGGSLLQKGEKKCQNEWNNTRTTTAHNRRHG